MPEKQNFLASARARAFFSLCAFEERARARSLSPAPAGRDFFKIARASVATLAAPTDDRQEKQAEKFFTCVHISW